MSTPPTGVVTFLFSDIEGSTQLWERKPALMQRAFARQEALMRAAMVAHDGYVYKMIGDAFQVAFASPEQAAAAAVDAQRGLHAEPWGEIGAIRVRMALHTGSTEERGDDYVGPLLNRVARLMGAGHGGQVLLTQATTEMLQRSLPPDVSLRDMGERRLKDLIQPERVYQLVIDGLPHEFPPLKTLDYRPNNLPVQLTSFVGREREMADVKRALAGTRLLTLTGAGGAGKTRLAMQAAADVIDEYENGVWLVELAPLADPTLVPQTVAAALSVREAAGGTVLDALTAYVRDKQLLLVLDNCEHLIAACAVLAESLLRAAPGLRILASSREALRIAGEVTYRVPSLQVPDAHAVLPTGALAGYESVQLFVERAAASQPGFALNDDNADAVAQICRRLDGIPLAIELAAARVRAMAVDTIAARLDDRFKLLTGGSRTALPRQRTLRAAIEWSYSLLSELPPSERALLRRLAAFAGGWTLEAAEIVCAWEDDPAAEALHAEDVLDLVTSLVDKSLIVLDAHAEGERYHLLETIREFALEHLRHAGEEDHVRARHAAYFFDHVAMAEPQLTTSRQREFLVRLDEDYDDVRLAVRWLTEHDSGQALHLVGALGTYWDIRGQFSEGRETLARVLQAAADGDPLARAKAQRAQGLLAFRQGDYGPAREIILAALVTSERGDDARGVAEALVHLGSLGYLQGDYVDARAHLERALSISRDSYISSVEAYALSNLGLIAANQGDEAGARRAYEQSLVVARANGDAVRIGKLLHNLGLLDMNYGNYDAARKHYEESLAVTRGLSDTWSVTYTLEGLGETAFRLGDIPAARRYFHESLSIAQALGLKTMVALASLGLANVARTEGDFPGAWGHMAESFRLLLALDDKSALSALLEDCGRLALAAGDPARATQAFSAAAVLRASIGEPPTSAERDAIESELGKAKGQLGADGFDRAWDAGRGLSVEAVAALIHEKLGVSPR